MNCYGGTSRYAIDLNHCDDIITATKHGKHLSRSKQVMPTMKANAEKEGRDEERQRAATKPLSTLVEILAGRPEMIERLAGFRVT